MIFQELNLVPSRTVAQNIYPWAVSRERAGTRADVSASSTAKALREQAERAC